METGLPVEVASPESISRSVAEEINALCLARQGHLVLGLPTGHTPIRLYRELTRRVRAGLLDLSRAVTFNLDEYVGLGPEHPASFRAFMEAHLLGLVPIGQAHALRGDAPAEELAATCEAYEAAIARAGGLDLVVLGLGRNGHIGFNEPGSPRDSRTRRVALSPSTRAANAGDFPPGEPVPEAALTMGIGTILEARRVRVLAFGAHKARIVRRLLDSSPGPELPASWLHDHPDATLSVDHAAASEL